VQARYPVNNVAAKYGTSAQTATDDPGEAYADWRREPLRKLENPWPLS
jgi:hypothetical protein